MLNLHAKILALSVGLLSLSDSFLAGDADHLPLCALLLHSSDALLRQYFFLSLNTFLLNLLLLAFIVGTD